MAEDVLRDLVEHGESLYVERKREPPKAPRLGAAAASFANMLGGFILLGVADGGEVVGWEKPSKADLQSYLGELLRREVDPLPPFIAEMRKLNGKPIGVIRIFESSDSPHVVRGTGAIYVRTSKGKEPVPVDDHRLILEMARRGREAEDAARRRLAESPAVATVFAAPDTGLSRPAEGVEVIARGGPVTVTPAFNEWALTRQAADQCSAVAADLLPQANLQGLMLARQESRITFGRASGARVAQKQVDGEDMAMALVDSAGVVAAGIKREPDEGETPLLHINDVFERELLPLSRSLAGLLVAGEAIGRAVIDVWVLLADGGRVLGSPGGELLAERPFRVAREITIPADEDEVEAVAREWHRELQREVGIEVFEDDPATGSS